MRKPSHNDFHIDVPNIGHFSFAKRTLDDHMAVAAEYSRLTQGVEHPTQWLDTYAQALAVIRVLVTAAPADFDPYDLDPFDDATYDKLVAVWLAMRAREDEFRKGKHKASQAESQGAGE